MRFAGKVLVLIAIFLALLQGGVLSIYEGLGPGVASMMAFQETRTADALTIGAFFSSGVAVSGMLGVLTSFLSIAWGTIFLACALGIGFWSAVRVLYPDAWVIVVLLAISVLLEVIAIIASKRKTDIERHTGTESQEERSLAGIPSGGAKSGEGFCPHCGTPVREQYTFCPKCGKELPSHVKREGPPSFWEPPRDSFEPRRSRAADFLGFVTLILILCGGIWFFRDAYISRNPGQPVAQSHFRPTQEPTARTESIRIPTKTEPPLATPAGPSVSPEPRNSVNIPGKTSSLVTAVPGPTKTDSVSSDVSPFVKSPGRVTGTNVNVREDHSLRAKAKARVTAGEEVEILDEWTEAAANNTAVLVKDVEIEIPGDGKKVFRKGLGITIMSRNDANGTVEFSIPSENTRNILRVPQSAVSEESRWPWYLIRKKDGRQGWVFGKYVSSVASPMSPDTGTISDSVSVRIPDKPQPVRSEELPVHFVESFLGTFGTYRDHVEKTLGKPRREAQRSVMKNGVVTEFVDSLYDGLTISYVDDAGRFRVESIVCSDAGYEFSGGLAVGMTKEEVRHIMGEPSRSASNEDKYSSGNQRGLVFIYDGDKVVRICAGALSE
jgi:hypothetical protein